MPRKPNPKRMAKKLQRNVRRLVKYDSAAPIHQMGTKRSLSPGERSHLLEFAKREAVTFKPKQSHWPTVARHVRGLNWRDRAEVRALKLSYAEFKHEAQRLRHRWPNILLMPERMKIASQRLKRIAEILESVASPKILQRFESLSRVLTELSNSNMLAGQEALLAGGPTDLKSAKTTYHQSLRLVNEASDQTDFGGFIGDHKPYTCRVFFETSAFDHAQQFANPKWGYIHATDKPTVLGIQLFDPDPKALLQFAKAMAKRRPKDPLVIFDLYGNVFYP